jgi:PAT family beta-lactamase induction signal transducer AmpG
VYARPRVLSFLFLGFSSGLPLALTAGTLAIWLTEAGVDLTTIGLFAAVGTPYSLKFLWSPLIDRAPFPVLTRLLGRRRGWMVATQAALAIALLALGAGHPAAAPGRTALAALLVAFCSASQDIVIDAYRIEILAEREQGAGAAMQVFGYRLGMLVSGAGALLAATYLDWSVVYAIMAGLVLVGVAAALLNPEPPVALGSAAPGPPKDESDSAGPLRAAGRWLSTAVVSPFAEFMGRPGWVVVLLFVMTFKLGDTLATTMTSPFLITIGFTKIQIAEVAKVYGFGATMTGLALGGALINGVGLIRSLWIAGVLQLVSNLMFAVQAAVGNHLGLLALTVGFENLAGGMGTAAFVAYLSSLCDVAYTATQYALLSSFMAVARTWLSSPAGWLVDHVNWAGIAAALGGAAWLPAASAERLNWIGFFVLTTFAAVPGLLLLAWLTRNRGYGLPAAAATASPEPRKD